MVITVPQDPQPQTSPPKQDPQPLRIAPTPPPGPPIGFDPMQRQPFPVPSAPTPPSPPPPGFAVAQALQQGDPDRAAKAQKLARELALPPDLVERNLEDVQSMAARRRLDVEEIAKLDPVLRAQLRNPEFAAVAYDDTTWLGRVDKVLTQYARGQLEVNLYRLQNWARQGQLTPDRLDQMQRIRAQLSTMPAADGFIGSAAKVVGQLSETVPEAAAMGGAAAALSFIPGGVAITAGRAFWAAFTGWSALQSMQIEAGAFYGEAVEKGIDPETANRMADWVGIVNAALEVGGMSVATKPIRDALVKKATAEALRRATLGEAVKAAGKAWGAGIVAETATEGLQEVVAILGEDGARIIGGKGEKTSWGDAFARVGDVMKETAQAMTVLGVVPGGVRFMTDLQRAKAADQTQQAMKDLAATRDGSALWRRSPERFGQFVAAATQGKPTETTYINSERFEEVLRQSEVSVDQFEAAHPAVVAKLREALETGADVAVPTSYYVERLQPTKLGPLLDQHAKWDPAGMSPAEAEQFRAEAPKLMKELAAEAEKVTEAEKTTAESARVVEEDIRKQIAAVGKFQGRAAREYARLYRDFATVAAAEEGVGVAEWHRKRGLGVEFAKDGESADAGVLNQSERRAITDTPEFKAWFGESKVVDEKGEPLVVFHGSRSPTEDIAFDFSKIGTNGRAEGAGFYFTTSETVAGGYAREGTLIKAWLAIKKPMPLQQKGFSSNDLRKIVKRAAELEAAATGDDIRDGFLSNYGDTYSSLASAINEAARLIASDELAVDQMGGMVGSGLSAEFVNRAVTEVTGFDGIVSDGFGGAGKAGGRIYVAFQPEQIKSVNNRGTFDPNDPNILRQPRRAWYDRQRRVATLTEQSDLSSFLHEAAHFFLDVYADQAAAPNASARVREGWQRLLDWFGVKDNAAWDALGAEGQRRHHEAFAASFELWLAEGKAPATGLQRIFDTFRRWLSRVYRSIVGELNDAHRAEFGTDLPALSPEIRDVMGRMLAAEEAVQARQAVDGVGPLWVDQKSSGMDDEQWAAYQEANRDRIQAAVREMDLRLAELDKQAKKVRGELSEQVGAELAERPVYAAQRFLRTAPAAEKLNRDTVLGYWPEEMLTDEASRKAAQAAIGKLNTMVSATGRPPDFVAERFEFRTGREMVQAIVQAQPFREAVAAEVEDRIVMSFPELATEESRRQTVLEAMHNEAQSDFVAGELSHAMKGQGKRSPRVLVQAARETARQMLGRMPVHEIRPGKFAAAAQRAAFEAGQAVESKDEAGIIVAKRRQLVQSELARLAYQAERNIDRALVRFDRAFGNDEKIAKARNFDVVMATRSVLALHGIGGDRAVGQASEWMRKLGEYDPTLADEIAPAISIATEGAKPYRDLAYEDFQILVEAFDELWHRAKRSKQIEIDGRTVARDAAVDEMLARVQPLLPKPGTAPTTSTTDREKQISGLLTTKAAMTRAEHMLRYLDGGDAGPFTRYLWGMLNDGVDTYMAQREKKLRKLHEIVSAVPWKNERILAPGLGPNGHVFANQQELFGAILHAGNLSNLRRLVVGGQGQGAWGEVFEKVPEGAPDFDASHWWKFFNDAIRAGQITKEMMDAAQAVWDFNEALKPDAQAAHKKATGRFFDEIKPESISTPWGEYRGGYVPAKVDPEKTPESRQRAGIQGIADIDRGFAESMPSSPTGFTKSRSALYARPLALNAALIMQHLDEVLRYIHVMPAVRDVLGLVRDKRLAASLNAIDPSMIDGVVLPMLERAAHNRMAKAGMSPFVDSIATALRTSTGMATMAGSIVNSLQQVTGISNARAYVKGRHLRAAAWEKLFPGNRMAERAADRSTFMQQRLASQIGQMQEEIRDTLNPSWWTNARNWTQRHAYYLQRLAQNHIDVVTWWGAYNQSIEQQGAKVAPEQAQRVAVREADSVVRRSQSSSRPIDVAAFEAGTPVARLFTQFGGYFNSVQNQIREQRGFTARTKATMLAFVMPTLVAAAIATALREGWDDEEGDGYSDEVAAWFFGSLARGAVSLVPFGGAVASLVSSEGNRVALAPAVSSAQAIVRTYFAAQDAVVEGAPLTMRDVRDAMTAITVLSGVPVGAVARPFLDLVPQERR